MQHSHSSGREIGVKIKYLDNPFGIKYKLNGFELGGCHPFQIRPVYILFQKGQAAEHVRASAYDAQGVGAERRARSAPRRKF